MGRITEYAYAARCTPKRGKPWIVVASIRGTATAVREWFTEGEADPKKAWKKMWLDNGYRIVRVKITALPNGEGS